jgi:TonB family protein
MTDLKAKIAKLLAETDLLIIPRMTIRDIVSSNWQKSYIDPNVRSAPRAYIQFEIQRDGSVANEFVKQSSGVPSLDRSGLRAIKASHFPPLPGGESRLVVEFWFEHSR